MTGKSCHQHHLQTQTIQPIKCTADTAKVATTTVEHFNAMMQEDHPKHHQFVETCGLKQGIKKFRQTRKNAAQKEMKQLHDRAVFQPIKINELTQKEKTRAMVSHVSSREERRSHQSMNLCRWKHSMKLHDKRRSSKSNSHDRINTVNSSNQSTRRS